MKNQLLLKLREFGYEELYKTSFFRNFSDEEIYNLLSYKKNDLKDYFYVVFSLRENHVLINDLVANNAKQVLSVVFGNTNRKYRYEFLKLLIESKFLQARNLLFATSSYLNNDSNFAKKDKLAAIFNIFAKNPSINGLDANKVILEINKCKSLNQLNALYNIFINPELLKNKNISIIVSLINANYNCKYFNYFNTLISKYGYIKLDKNAEKLRYLLRETKDEKAKIIFHCLREPLMLRGNTFEVLMDYLKLLHGRNNYTVFFDCIDYLILNKKYVSDYVLLQVADAFAHAKSEAQENGIIELTRSKAILKGEYSRVFIESIMRVKGNKDYQVEAILLLSKYENVFSNHKVLDNLLAAILQCDTRERTRCLAINPDAFYRTECFDELIKRVLRADRKSLIYIETFLAKTNLYKREDMVNLLDKLLEYKTDYHKSIYNHLLAMRELFDYDYNFVFILLSVCNEEQSYSLEYLCEQGFYKSEYFSLIKHLPLLDSEEQIDIFEKLVLNIDVLGYNEVFNLIGLLRNENVNLDLLNQEIDNKFNNRDYVIDYDSFDAERKTK